MATQTIAKRTTNESVKMVSYRLPAPLLAELSDLSDRLAISRNLLVETAIREKIATMTQKRN